MRLPRLTLIETLDLPGLGCSKELPSRRGGVSTQEEGPGSACSVVWLVPPAFRGAEGMLLFLNIFLGVETKFL